MALVTSKIPSTAVVKQANAVWRTLKLRKRWTLSLVLGMACVLFSIVAIGKLNVMSIIEKFSILFYFTKKNLSSPMWLG